MSQTIIGGSFGRGFRVVGGKSASEAEVLARLISSEAADGMPHLMEQVVGTGLEGTVFQLIIDAMDRANVSPDDLMDAVVKQGMEDAFFAALLRALDRAKEREVRDEAAEPKKV
ncbi:MAG: hypothetical protein EXS59_02105 [Candidatus Taylorbacteria bacterium]|nr:hypothetical protein [Candidatus Taylorbacteria bacterium]